jgi:histidine triad (HIT) family protein
MDDADDCVFCSIVAGEAPAHRVYEDEDAVAFLDANPVARGHTLVVPRDHYPTLLEMPAGTTTATFSAARTVAEAIEETLDPAGLNLVQSNGSAAGQDVFHVHVHLIPRREDDGISFAPSRRAYEGEEGATVAGTIREGL